MYCQNCGKNNISAAIYCMHCGHKTDKAQEIKLADENIQNNSAKIIGKQRCKCDRIKRNVYKDYKFTGQRVCLKCTKKGYCPVCGEKLRTKSAEQCGKCSSSWRDHPPIQDIQSQQIYREKFTKRDAEEEKIKCPNCKSTQITSHKRGFSGVKAVGGAVLTGGVGLLAGTIGSNKIILTCLACTKQFKVGEDFEGLKRKRKHEAAAMKSPFFWILYIGLLISIVWLISSC